MLKSIDVKRLYVFFILVTFFTFLDIFYFVYFFIFKNVGKRKNGNEIIQAIIGNVFIQRLQTFFCFCHFYIFNVIIFI